jgi:hypothetical protein
MEIQLVMLRYFFKYIYNATQQDLSLNIYVLHEILFGKETFCQLK